VPAPADNGQPDSPPQPHEPQIRHDIRWQGPCVKPRNLL
jgi:hypothetical protein